MTIQIVHFRRNAAHFLLPPDTPPGEQPDGSVICAIYDCPEQLPADRLLGRLKGLFPTPGTLRVCFDDLPVRDGGCCGGHCGG